MSYLRVVAVALVLLGVGFLMCPQVPTGDSSVLVRDSLRGDPGTFHASCVLRSGGKRQNFSMHGSGRSLLESIEISLPADAPSRREVLQAFEDAAHGVRYTLLIEGTDRIAGRSCTTVRLKPPSKKHEWFQVWIDPSTHIILAWRHWSHGGRLISSTGTTHLRSATKQDHRYSSDE